MESNQINYYMNTYTRIAARSKEIIDQMNQLLAIKSAEGEIDLEQIELIEGDLYTLLQAQQYNMQALEGMIMNRRESSEINNGISQDQIALASLQGMTMEQINVMTTGFAGQVEPSEETKEVEEVAPEVKETPVVEDKQETMEDMLAYEESTYPTKDGQRIFRFKRRLVGGIVEMPGMQTNMDKSDTYFVPEKMVLDMGVEDGDLLSIKSKYNKDGVIRYNFEIAERNEDQSPSRMSYEFCHVREDVSPIAPSSFYVERSYTQGAFVALKNGSYYELERLYLPEGDIEYRNIQENDIIKIVYWVTSPEETVRIVDVADLPGGEEARPKSETKPAKKDTVKKEVAEVDKSLYPELDGKSIVVVGFEPFHTRYESVLSRYGAEPTLLTGDEGITSVASAIDKADLVIFVIEMMSHGAYDTFKEHAKSSNVRHVLSTKSGANFIAHLANSTLAESAQA